MPAPDLSLYSTKAVLILDNEGRRVFVKYYTPPHGADPHSPDHNLLTNVKEQLRFEKGLFEKTTKQNSDATIYEGNIVIYKQVVDITLYIVGGLDESEAMLYQALAGLRDALEILLRYSRHHQSIYGHSNIDIQWIGGQCWKIMI